MKFNSLIIIDKSELGKTYLTADIANKLIQNNKIVLREKLTNLLDRIKEN